MDNQKKLILICATASAIAPSIMAEYCVNTPQNFDSKYYYSSPNYANTPVSNSCYVKLLKPEPPELTYPYSDTANSRIYSVSVSGTASTTTTTTTLPLEYLVKT